MMGFWGFLASVVGALAWPLVILLVATEYREELGALLSNTVSRSRGSNRIDLSRELSTLTAAAAPLALPDLTIDADGDRAAPPPTVPPGPSLTDEVEAVALVAPAAAIALVWTRVEYALMTAARRCAPADEAAAMLTLSHSLKFLQSEGYLTSNVQLLLERLRNLRKDVIHPSVGLANVSEQDALQVAEVAERCIHHLSSLQRRAD